LATSDVTWYGARNATIDALAEAVYDLGSRGGELDKPVVDQTGLEGRFDYILELPAGIISLLNAVREQPGLKLVRSRGKIRTMIIDHLERPSEN
jgi:uncharacterized protein (TIGR03435 family)